MFLAVFTSELAAYPQAVQRKPARLSRDLPSTWEEVRHRLRVVADGLLLHDHRPFGEPHVLRPGLGELTAAFRQSRHRPASLCE